MHYFGYLWDFILDEGMKTYFLQKKLNEIKLHWGQVKKKNSQDGLQPWIWEIISNDHMNTHIKALFYLLIDSASAQPWFFFQYNLTMQLFMYNSAFLTTRKTLRKLQQDPGYFSKQLLLIANGLAPCKQMWGPCWSPLSKAHGSLLTCNTAISKGTWLI